MGRLTAAQREFLVFLASNEDGVLMSQVLKAGHSRKTMASTLKKGLSDWTSIYRVPTCITLSEFEHEQLSTSYLWITEAGRSALAASPDTKGMGNG